MRKYKPIKKMVVVGGGVAGWVTANYLNSVLPLFKKQYGDEVSVTLIDSDRIPRIGVGESTTHRFKHFITGGHGYDFPHLNLEEFLLESKATYKMGVKLIGWNDGTADDYYWNPFDSIGHLDINFPEFFDGLRSKRIAENASTAFNLHQQLMENHYGPYIRIDDDWHRSSAPTDGYGFHFDANLGADYVERKTLLETNVTKITGEVRFVDRDTDGVITSLQLADGSTVDGDLFFDCSGFSRVLMNAVADENKADWYDYTNELPLNRALLFPKPRDAGEDIPSYTVSRALSSGWVFEIPTQDHYGRGYIFCDKFQTDEEALAEVRSVYGNDINAVRYLDMANGRLEKFWVKNAVAVGLSSGFAEPLEATSIDATIQQISKFVHGFLMHEMVVDHETPLHIEYNEKMIDLWDSIRDWLSIHYVSDREDSDFWVYMSQPERRVHIQKMLDLWSYRMPRKDEHGFQGTALTYHVLSGMNILNPEIARRELDYYDAWEETGYQQLLIQDDVKYRLDHAASNLDTLRRITKNMDL